MIRLKNILVATDLSSLSRCAIRHGAELARQFSAQLHLLTVASYPFSQFAAECQQDYGLSIEDCEAEHFAAAVKQLSEIDVSPLPDSQVIRATQKGFPVQEILKYATDHHIDLLVVGTHGLTGLQHIFMGSVAEMIVRTAPCPVLTVRDASHHFVPMDAAVA